MNRSTRRLTASAALVLLVGLLAFAGVAQAATTVVVKPNATSGWGILPSGAVAVTTNNATGAIVAGPGGQPGGLQPGSVEYQTKSSPGGKPQLYAPASLAGVKFTDLTKLSYDTYISQYAFGSWLVHTINVKIDLDGNPGTTGDQYLMVFEPCYTVNGCTSAVQSLNTWKTWDAVTANAIWWSTGSIPGTAFVVPFNSFAPLTSIYSTYPNATIVFLEFQAGQGSGGAPWNNFIGNLDGVTIGIANVDTTYDFEPVIQCTTVCYVDAATGNDSNGGASASDAKKTIQAGVTQVDPAGQVIVAAGAYGENVSIPKAVTLTGAQAGNPVGGRTFGGGSESTVTGMATISAPGVTIDGFSLTNPNQSGVILVKTAGDNAVLENNLVKNVGVSFAGDVQAIYLERGPDNVSILGNSIDNVQSSGRSAKAIFIGDSTSPDPSLNIAIQGNLLTNIASSVKGAYAIQVNNGASTSPSATGYTTVAIEDNTITGLSGHWAHAIGLEGDTPGVVVTGNSIDNVTDADTPAAPDAVGVWFEDNPSFSTAEVHENNFYAVAFGVAVQPALTGGSADAACNWWNSASGPTTPANPMGTGDLVSSNVVFAPWLTAPAPGGPCNGSTPRQAKATTAGYLAGLLPTGDKKTDDRIQKAIGKINDSLDAQLWSDDSHLTKKGNQVFDREKDAVNELQKIVKDGGPFAGQAQIASLALVGADQSLAQTAINDAIAANGDAKEIAKAQDEMSKAQDELNKGKPDNAIEHYKQAWSHATKA